MSTDEGAAISLLKRAVELDSKKQFTESLVCYKEGLNMLMDVIKGCNNESKKTAFRSKALEYMERAEKIQKYVEDQKKSGQYHEQIQIQENSIGHSYQSLFGRFLDENVTKIDVQDAYIRSHHQIMNFLRLCELLVKSCKNLSQINLLTTIDNSQQGSMEQNEKLNLLSQELALKKIKFEHNYSETLHDREIKLNTGWIIKIGRGLDLFKAPKCRMAIGYFDLDLRPCYETIVDIFHKSTLIKS